MMKLLHEFVYQSSLDAGWEVNCLVSWEECKLRGLLLSCHGTRICFLSGSCPRNVCCQTFKQSLPANLCQSVDFMVLNQSSVFSMRGIKTFKMLDITSFCEVFSLFLLLKLEDGLIIHTFSNNSNSNLVNCQQK